jgi:hypothetical protein
MSNRWLKAARVLAVLARIHRPAAFLKVEDVLDNCTEEELDFYYAKLVGDKRV